MATIVGASVLELAQGLMRRCQTIPNLKCYDIQSPKPEPPACCVLGPVRWTYHQTLDGVWLPVFELALYVNDANLVEAQRQLFAYVAPSGPKSIPAALYGDPSLGGVANDTRVVGGSRPAQVVETAGGSLLSVALEVEVWAM